MSDSFCPLPWKHISTITNGTMRACCQCIYEPYGILKKDNGEEYHASKDSFLEARNSQELKDIRKEMLQGKKPEVCRLCWQEEAVGTRSRRVWELSRNPGLLEKAQEKTKPDGSIDQEEFPLTYIDLRLGNQCNLRCRYCGPTDSSSWYSDYVKLRAQHEENPAFHFYDKKYDLVQGKSGWTVNSNDFNWPENPAFLEMIEKTLEHVDSFYFTGGEPTLIKAHWDLLEKCIKKGIAKKIYLEYNSNLSFINDKHLEIWSHFRGLGLACSIDAMGDAAVFLRPPVEWSKVETNIFKVVNANFRVDAIISTTLSVFNCLRFMGILEFYTKIKGQNFPWLPTAHFLEHPPYYSMKILPPKAKQFVSDEYDKFQERILPLLTEEDAVAFKARVVSIKNYLNSEDWSDKIKEFYRETEKLDQMRDQKFVTTFPDIHRLLQMT